MTYPKLLSARLLDKDKSVMVGDPLANAFDISGFDEKNGPGSAQCSLSLSEAGATQLIPGRYIQVLSDGVPIFTFRVEGNPEYKVIGEGEERDAIVIVSGRGWGADFEEATIYPEAELGIGIDTSWRIFSFASPSFPNAGAWAAAVEEYEYLAGVSYPDAINPYRAPVVNGFRYPAPISFPWPTSPNVYDPASPPGVNYVNTYWIYAAGHELDLGLQFFRKDLVITTEGIYDFAVTADNFFTLFLEGVPILGHREEHYIWKGWLEEPIFLPVGTYTIAAVVENIIGPPVNPTALLMNVYQLGDGDLPDTHFLSTDDTWVAEYMATGWPGWTPGQIIAQIITESTARGAIDNLAGDSFTDLLDTSGAAWSDAIDNSQYVTAFSINVGQTALDLLMKLSKEGHIDWHVRPDTLTLDAWAPGNMGTTPGVTLAQAVNLRSLERGATTTYANALLVQYDKGAVEVIDSAAITSFGRRVEGTLQTEAATIEEATRLGQLELAERSAEDWPAVVVTIEPTSTDDCPYEGINIGDTVTAPAVGGGTADIEILTFRFSQDELGYAIWQSELNRRVRSYLREDIDLLQQIGGKANIVGGTFR